MKTRAKSCSLGARILAAGFFTLLALAAPPAAGEDASARQRAALVEALATMEGPTGPRIDPGVLAVMRKVPRHEFVPSSQRAHAYENRPLPIGHGQTISQPYIVAAMTELLNLRHGAVVLEVGTGSGYQAAVLAERARTVYTIEIIEPLARRAEETLRRLGYTNVRQRSGDGYDGWPEAGPFDAIIVTAAASHVPPPLLRQLRPGGRMVIPVGAPFLTQWLMLLEKDLDGTVRTRQIMAVRFVPLVGGR